MSRVRKGRKAWLVTWTWAGEHAKVPDHDVIAAILRPQASPETVKRMVELLYAAREYDPADKLAALTSNPYPARFNAIPVEYLSGDGSVFKQTVPFEGQIVCGHNPFLYARLVDNLRLRDSANPDVGLVWDERPPPGALRLG